MLVRLSGRTWQCGYHWADLRKIEYWGLLWKHVK